MQDVLYIDDIDQAAALLKPLRIELLKRMAMPRSCPELASELGETTQKLYYHVKILEKAGLIEKIEERRVGGIMEGQYQATARAYWLSPGLVGRIGGQAKATDQLSLGYLLSLAEDLQYEVGQLAERTDVNIPSLGLSAQIYLEDGSRRQAFLEELQGAVQSLAEKYGVLSGDDRNASTYRLLFAVYPLPEQILESAGENEDRVIEEKGKQS